MKKIFIIKHYDNSLLGEFKEDFILNFSEVHDIHVYSYKLTKFQVQLSRYTYGILSKFNIKIPWSKKNHDIINFAMIFGPDFSKFLKSSIKSGSVSAYMMDAWPQYFDRIKTAIRYYDIETLFFSSKQVTEYFQKENIIKNAIWLPEAINPKKYVFKKLKDKNKDVISIGRKWKQYHARIIEPLIINNKSYKYEIDKTLMFEISSDLFKELSDSKVSICVPSIITHPLRSGDINTMTQRYLQSMASGCLVLGISPPEMIDLFGYDPVIQIEENNEAEQILNILNNIERYQDLVDKNYTTVLSSHTFHNRWLLIIEHFLKQCN